jgi:hypothetical protein
MRMQLLAALAVFRTIRFRGAGNFRLCVCGRGGGRGGAARLDERMNSIDAQSVVQSLVTFVQYSPVLMD